MDGYILTSISAFALALTVTADKLMVGDFYQNNPRNAWFVSSVLGVLLGLSATLIAWYCFGEGDGLKQIILFGSGEMLFLSLPMVFAGVLVSLTLRSYFFCMSMSNFTTSVAVAIAATPVFVFGTQLLISGEVWTIWHWISFIITIIGLIGFELSAEHDPSNRESRLNKYLIGVIGFGTTYLVLIDVLFPVIETNLNVNEIQASLVAMPYYWLGFAFGIISYRHREVRKFTRTIFMRLQFIALILILEIIGASFYFFEFFGLSKISATLVALIIGAHIILVWIFDLYVSKQYKMAITKNEDLTQVLFFKLPTKNLEAYDISKVTLGLQALFIALTLTGLILWP